MQAYTELNFKLELTMTKVTNTTRNTIQTAGLKIEQMFI